MTAAQIDVQTQFILLPIAFLVFLAITVSFVYFGLRYMGDIDDPK